MKNGILSEEEGFDLLVDGVQRSLRDEKDSAFSAARELKRGNRNSIVEIRDGSSGAANAASLVSF